MPSSIPYDPSLVLANVVSVQAIEIVEGISIAQAPADAAQEDLNALLASRRSLDMTKTELGNLGIDVGDLTAAIAELNTSIGKAAADYCKAKITAEATIRPLRAQIHSVHVNCESPVDYTKTEIKTMPLAADSISLDCQYFSRDAERQDSNTFASHISSFVSASTSSLGEKRSAQMTSAANIQAHQQSERHSLEGTLVISVSCTHKNASILAPLILNVDKGIKVWNDLFPQDRIIPTNRGKMIALGQSDDPDGTAKYQIISGMTFGSSFVGMVHVLNTTDTSVSANMSSYVSSLQSQMDAGLWFEQASGGFGGDSSISNSVKNLISTQNITSHVTLLCMGTIPSIVANDVVLAFKSYTDFDPKSSMEAVATIQNATAADQGTVKSSADAARTGGQMISLEGGKMKAALEAVAEHSDGKNKILDINSMMGALDDYLKKASEGKTGVPINYYLKDITKSMLAEMWVSKYYPGEYLQIKGDDSETTPARASAGAAATASADAAPAPAASGGDAGGDAGGEAASS